MNADEARKFIRAKTAEDLTILDVRQPGKHEKGHIPGARLIHLPEPDKRLTTVSSRLSIAQSKAEAGVPCSFRPPKGFNDVINLSDGFRAWNGKAAIGGEKQGKTFFSKSCRDGN